MARRSVCPVCGASAAAEPFFADEEWEVRRCSRCTLAWVVDPHAGPGETGFAWDEEVVEESLRRRRMHEDRVDRVERYRPAPRAWLDVGCGGGGLLQCASERGFEVEGTELSPSAETITRKLGIPVHRCPLDLALPALARPAYGVVSYFHVIEHVHDPVGELALARRLVGEAGVLVVEVPFFDTVLWKVLGARHRHFYPSHLSYFNTTSLRTLLARAGFEVLEMQAVPYVLSVGWALMRLGVPAADRLRARLPGAVTERSLRINTREYLLAMARKSEA